MKLANLFEANEKNLISMKVNCRLVTPQQDWRGDFECMHKGLTSLEGAPSSVEGNFNCLDNLITSLKGAPSPVQGFFSCHKNKLTSLEGGPGWVGGNFFCDSNKLTSLEGAPQIIGGLFDCSSNKLTSLKDIHKIIITIGTFFNATKNPIKSHILGLLLINGLRHVTLSNPKINAILNKHLPNKIGNKGVLACQSELLDAGFDEFAQI
jgi:hypothetical protein